jgi:hemolysin D
MKEASERVVPFPRPAPRRSNLERTFLPAALEIVESPPSPIGRAIVFVIIAAFCLALGWASWATIDIIATAQGKVVPTGRSKVVQPFGVAVIRAIHVRDGETVRAGDVLIELDPTMDHAEEEHLRNDLLAADLDVARYRAALGAAADPVADFHPPADADPVRVANVREALMAQLQEQRAKVAALERQAAQKAAEIETARATSGKLEAEIPLQQQRVDMRKTLLAKGLESKILYLQEAQDLVVNEKELVVQRSREKEAEAALQAIDAQRAQLASEFRRTMSDELLKAAAKAAGLSQDLIKAARKTGLQQLTAPVDGTVQQLAVHTIGGVVTPAQALLVVVPADSRLEIEAMVSNRDIGFVKPGQAADIKVDTFNYTRYGLLRGKVESVSADSVTPDKREDAPNARPTGLDKDGSAANDSGSKEPVYVARVSLEKTAMVIDDQPTELGPGMAVTVEIKTGSRRMISFLLSPLLRYGHESLRER